MKIEYNGVNVELTDNELSDLSDFISDLRSQCNMSASQIFDFVMLDIIRKKRMNKINSVLHEIYK